MLANSLRYPWLRAEAAPSLTPAPKRSPRWVDEVQPRSRSARLSRRSAQVDQVRASPSNHRRGLCRHRQVSEYIPEPGRPARSSPCAAGVMGNANAFRRSLAPTCSVSCDASRPALMSAAAASSEHHVAVKPCATWRTSVADNFWAGRCRKVLPIMLPKLPDLCRQQHPSPMRASLVGRLRREATRQSPP